MIYPSSHKLDQIESLHFFLFIHSLFIYLFIYLFLQVQRDPHFHYAHPSYSYLQFGEVYDGVILSLIMMHNGKRYLHTHSYVFYNERPITFSEGIRQVVTCSCDPNHHDHIDALQPYSDVMIQKECLHVKCVNIVSKWQVEHGDEEVPYRSTEVSK